MRKLLLVAFFVLISGFALFQARFLILGPRISVDSPASESTVDAGALTLAGVARNVSYLSLDGRRIYTEPDGHFEERLIAHEGINIIKLEASDRFGRDTTKLLRILAR